MKVVVALLAVVAVVAAGDVYQAKPAYGHGHGYQKDYDYAPAKYDFAWAVKDDKYYVDMGQTENRYGDNTKGEYWVALPDGRRQIVNYYVDGYSGFVADVKYSGDYKPVVYQQDYKPVYKEEYKPVYKEEYKPAYKEEYKQEY